MSQSKTGGEQKKAALRPDTTEAASSFSLVDAGKEDGNLEKVLSPGGGVIEILSSTAEHSEGYLSGQQSLYSKEQFAEVAARNIGDLLEELLSPEQITSDSRFQEVVRVLKQSVLGLSIPSGSRFVVTKIDLVWGVMRGNFTTRDGVFGDFSIDRQGRCDHFFF